MLRLLPCRVVVRPSLGEQVSVSGSVDASGATGGGSILIGGDFQGGNPDLSNAKTVDISGTLAADAVASGEGGRIIVWADEVTTFTGGLSATGASLGSGGFAEVSGKNILNFDGSVDLTSDNGVTGSLLLDPTNITISNVGSHTSISGTTILEPSAAAGSVISLSTLNTSSSKCECDDTDCSWRWRRGRQYFSGLRTCNYWL